MSRADDRREAKKQKARERRFSSDKKTRDRQRKKDEEDEAKPKFAAVIGGRGVETASIGSLEAAQDVAEIADKGDIGKETKKEIEQRKSRERRTQADADETEEERVQALAKKFNTTVVKVREAERDFEVRTGKPRRTAFVFTDPKTGVLRATQAEGGFTPEERFIKTITTEVEVGSAEAAQTGGPFAVQLDQEEDPLARDAELGAVDEVAPKFFDESEEGGPASSVDEGETFSFQRQFAADLSQEGGVGQSTAATRAIPVGDGEFVTLEFWATLTAREKRLLRNVGTAEFDRRRKLGAGIAFGTAVTERLRSAEDIQVVRTARDADKVSVALVRLVRDPDGLDIGISGPVATSGFISLPRDLPDNLEQIVRTNIARGMQQNPDISTADFLQFLVAAGWEEQFNQEARRISSRVVPDNDPDTIALNNAPNRAQTLFGFTDEDIAKQGLFGSIATAHPTRIGARIVALKIASAVGKAKNAGGSGKNAVVRTVKDVAKLRLRTDPGEILVGFGPTISVRFVKASDPSARLIRDAGRAVMRGRVKSRGGPPPPKPEIPKRPQPQRGDAFTRAQVAKGIIEPGLASEAVVSPSFATFTAGRTQAQAAKAAQIASARASQAATRAATAEASTFEPTVARLAESVIAKTPIITAARAQATEALVRTKREELFDESQEGGPVEPLAMQEAAPGVQINIEPIQAAGSLDMPTIEPATISLPTIEGDEGVQGAIEEAAIEEEFTAPVSAPEGAPGQFTEPATQVATPPAEVTEAGGAVAPAAVEERLPEALAGPQIETLAQDTFAPQEERQPEPEAFAAPEPAEDVPQPPAPPAPALPAPAPPAPPDPTLPGPGPGPGQPAPQPGQPIAQAPAPPAPKALPPVPEGTLPPVPKGKVDFGDPLEEGEGLSGRFPRLVGTRSGDIFIYADLVTGEKFTSTVPRFGVVPSDRNLDAKSAFKVITVSDTKGQPTSFLLDDQEISLSGSGVRIFGRGTRVPRRERTSTPFVLR